MRDELIHDWNVEPGTPPRPGPFMLDDETLRDGLQSPSVTDPPIEKKRELLHLMNRLGIDTANIGLPGAGPRAESDVEALCREIATAKRENVLLRFGRTAWARSFRKNSPSKTPPSIKCCCKGPSTATFPRRKRPASWPKSAASSNRAARCCSTS